MNNRELVITAMLKGCVSNLQKTKETLDNLQEFPMDNDKLRLIEDAIWCICDARDDIKAILPDERRFCRGCHAEVTNTMYCSCGDFELKKECTLSYNEMLDHQKLV